MSETESVWIRALVPDDVGRVSAVLGLARLHQGDGVYLVAWLGDEPVGHVHLALTDPPELQDVSVRPEYRRCGVASASTRPAGFAGWTHCQWTRLKCVPMFFRAAAFARRTPSSQRSVQNPAWG